LSMVRRLGDEGPWAPQGPGIAGLFFGGAYFLMFCAGVVGEWRVGCARGALREWCGAK